MATGKGTKKGERIRNLSKKFEKLSDKDKALHKDRSDTDSDMGDVSKGASNTTKCGTCNKEVADTDKALECEVCLDWYHIRCQKVTIRLYEALKSADDEDGCSWFCSFCRRGAKKLQLEVIALKREQLELKETVGNLATTLDVHTKDIDELKVHADSQVSTSTKLRKDLTATEIKVSKLEEQLQEHTAATEKKVDKLEEQLQEHTHTAGAQFTAGNTGPKEITQAQLRRELSELEDINMRKKNLIFYNFPETESEEMDVEAVKTLIKEEFNLIIEPQGSKRFGKPAENKIRLLKVEFKSLGDKKQVLGKATELRLSNNDNFKRVYIRPDMTSKQLAESKNLKEQLTLRREAEPEKKFTIRRGEIVEKEDQ